MVPENLPTFMKKRENHKFRRILSTAYPSTSKRNSKSSEKNILFLFFQTALVGQRRGWRDLCGRAAMNPAVAV
jgi:hypothetical protein